VSDMIPLNAMGQQLRRHLQGSSGAIKSFVFTLQTPIQGNKF